MKYYKKYMDRQEVSPAVHERLLNLERPKRRPARPWVRFGALAACAALILGAGVWRLAPGESLVEDRQSAAQFVPGYELQPGEQDTVGPGYDELPRIDYGSKMEQSRGSMKASMDYSAPEDSTSRALTREDLAALAGGEEALENQLGWEGFQFTGMAIFDGEGEVWEMYLAGKREDLYFELELAPDALPLTCVITEPRAVTEVWGVEITARYSGIHGEGPNREVWMPESREVEFIANGVGCRFTIYGLEGQGAAVEEMVSRFVRQAILEGFYLQNVLQGGNIT